jgi:AraC-like DNA-binding protein
VDVRANVGKALASLQTCERAREIAGILNSNQHGNSERKEREREQRRNSIIDAAEKIFFTKGIAGATMDDVAAEAELSKGTLLSVFYEQGRPSLCHLLRGLDYYG